MYAWKNELLVKHLVMVFYSYNVAERVGFEPTCRLPDKTLSRRPRYDHFGTSPGRSFVESRQSLRSVVSRRVEVAALGYSEIRALASCLEEPLHQLTGFFRQHSFHDRDSVIERRMVEHAHH